MAVAHALNFACFCDVAGACPSLGVERRIDMEDLVSPVCEGSNNYHLHTEDGGPFRVEPSFGAPSEMSLGAKATSQLEGALH